MIAENRSSSTSNWFANSPLRVTKQFGARGYQSSIDQGVAWQHTGVLSLEFKTNLNGSKKSKLFCPSMLLLKLKLNRLQNHYPMFDFEKLIVYQKSKEFNTNVHSFLLNTTLDRNINDQLKRAAFSIMLNIAEGSGRFTKVDKIISRGSVFDCIAIIDFPYNMFKFTSMLL